MNALVALIPSFLEWIITTSFMASVMVVLILVVKYVMQERLPVKWQYMLWFVVLIRLLLPWAPESSFSLYNVFSFTTQIHQQSTPSVLTVVNDPNKIAKSTVATTASAAQQDMQSTPSTSQSESHVPIHQNTLSDTAQPSLIPIGLFLVWLLGVLAFAAYLVVVNRKFGRKMKAGAYASANTDHLNVLQQCGHELNITRNIPLMMTTEVDGPTLYGCKRPKILLPATGVERFLSKELRYIFLHELVHLKRKDIVVNGIMTVLLIVHWFNPVLWYAARKMREDQECSCDAKVISYIQSDEVRDYGYTIVKLLEKRAAHSSRFVATAHFTTDKSLIKRRIKLISMFKRRSYVWSALGIAILAIFTGVALTNATAEGQATLQDPIRVAYEDHPLLLTVDESIREQVELTIIDLMTRHNTVLPLKKITPVPSEKGLFIEFIGEDNGPASIWISSETGGLNSENLRLPLPLASVNPLLLQRAEQAIMEKGFEGTPNFKVRTAQAGTKIQTRFEDKKARATVLFLDDEIAYVSYAVDPAKITVEQDQRGQQAFATLRGKKIERLTGASRYFSDTHSYLALMYGPDGVVLFHPISYEILEISDSSLADFLKVGYDEQERVNRDKRLLSVTDKQVTNAASPIVRQLLGRDLNDYTMTRDNKRPGSATFIKEGKHSFSVSYNAQGEIWMVKNWER
ncbi:M56 family metallopeptidase [Paenibacillus sp. 481]|uniref:M56 family metallopeptidase n=1 Tax=Paenibacillus sp. 481 TaxID=2835869 RepID=UPI001E628BCA|nr:M56 family metallopeptidase [Paenibacillus sp. 481]UHA72139.1 M56 family metallopeptidase [Paenibacillus sp. 481]